MVPVGIGSASITLTVGELSATRIYTVVPELSTHVEVCIRAEVAPDEDSEETIYGGMGMKLVRSGKGRYEVVTESRVIVGSPSDLHVVSAVSNRCGWQTYCQSGISSDR